MASEATPAVSGPRGHAAPPLAAAEARPQPGRGRRVGGRGRGGGERVRRRQVARRGARHHAAVQRGPPPVRGEEARAAVREPAARGQRAPGGERRVLEAQRQPRRLLLPRLRVRVLRARRPGGGRGGARPRAPAGRRRPAGALLAERPLLHLADGPLEEALAGLAPRAVAGARRGGWGGQEAHRLPRAPGHGPPGLVGRGWWGLRSSGSPATWGGLRIKILELWLSRNSGRNPGLNSGRQPVVEPRAPRG